MQFVRGWLVVVSLAITCVVSDAGRSAARPIQAAKAPSAALADTVVQQAQTMSDAGIDQDYATLADFMYPRVLAALGGRAAAIARMRQDSDSDVDEEYGVTAIRVLSASAPVEAGSELHCLVTRHQYMYGPGVFFRVKTFLIAASSDAGENWTFVNVPRRDPDAIKSIFPAWNPSLKIPTPSEPERLRTDLVIDHVSN